MKNMAYPKAFWCLVFLLVVFTVYVVVDIQHVTPEAIKKYYQVVAEAPRKMRESSLAQEVNTDHPRKGLLKTIWLNQGPYARVTEMEADSSELSMNMNESKTELIET